MFDFSKTVYSSEPEDGGVDWATILHEIVRLYYRPIKDDKYYKATQAISDYVKNKGYDGVSYVSYFTACMNYTFFSVVHTFYERKSSRLVAMQGCEQHYYDFNNKNNFSTNVKGIEFDRKEHQYMLDDIRRLLEENSSN